VNRRRALGLGLRLAGGTAAALLLGGHTPYGQWVVYRKKHLLIGCHRSDPQTYALAKRVVRLLEEHLPAARSRVARAPDAGRLASLLGTAQMDVAILGRADAAAMLQGSGSFAPYGAIDLRALTPLDGRLLIARADFPERHAWLVTAALAATDVAPAADPSGDPGIPWHPGSRAFLEGGPEPGVD
jgi:hypothetical protein